MNIETESALVATPIRVLWQGWESDTFALKRKGWRVFVSKNAWEDEFELSLVDPMKQLALMGALQLRSVSFASDWNSGIVAYLRHGIELKGYRALDRAMIHSVTGSQWDSWDSASATDGLAYISERTIRELNIFKFEQPREIIIPALSVDECLNQILKIQFPEQKLIKELDRKVVAPKAEVKIYSLVG